MRNSSLGPIMDPSLNLNFCTCCWATLGVENSLVGQEEPELKLGSHFELELELGFFLIASIAELISAPRIVRWCMRNPNSSLCRISDPTSLRSIFICFVSTSKLLMAPKVIQQCMRNSSLSLGPIWDLSLNSGLFLFFFVATLANLLSNPRVIWQHTRNRNSSLHPIWDSSLSSSFVLVFCCKPYRVTLDVENSLVTYEEPKFKLRSHFTLEIHVFFMFFVVVGTTSLLLTPILVLERTMNPTSTQFFWKNPKTFWIWT